MKTIKSITVAIIFVGLAILSGCDSKDMKFDQPDWAKPKPKQKEDEAQAMEFAKTRQENKKLQADLSTLTSQNTILDARVKELTSREDRMTQEINNLKLDNISLRKQVEVLSDVPAQRDRLQLQLDTAQKKIAELENQLEKAKQK